MDGLHRLGRTDRTLLWGTAALIMFTLGAVAVARTNGGPAVVGADDSRLCYNSAGVGAACLPQPSIDFEGVAVSPSAVPAEPKMSPASPASPSVSRPAPTITRAPTAKPPASRKASKPVWAVGFSYQVGAQVSYQGGVYACLQSHTSQVDWSPVAAAALWSRVS